MITDDQDMPIMNPDNTPYKAMRKQSDADIVPRAALGMLNLPNANRSTSSLLDAVLGGDDGTRHSFNAPAGSGAASTSDSGAVPVRAIAQPYIPARPVAPGISPLNAGRPVCRRSVRDPRRPGESRRGSNSNTETTDSWDRMSDADSARINDGEIDGEDADQEKMQALERVVNKRYVLPSDYFGLSSSFEQPVSRYAKNSLIISKSVLPALESELAALNARIREAEERLARAAAGTTPAA